MTADPVFVPFKKSGFEHPKCYLSAAKGCSNKISQEHYISEALLHKIERHNSTIDVCGLYAAKPVGQIFLPNKAFPRKPYR